MASRAAWKRKMVFIGNIETTTLIKSYVSLAKIPTETFKIIEMCSTVVEQIV